MAAGGGRDDAVALVDATSRCLCTAVRVGSSSHALRLVLALDGLLARCSEGGESIEQLVESLEAAALPVRKDETEPEAAAQRLLEGIQKSCEHLDCVAASEDAELMAALQRRRVDRRRRRTGGVDALLWLALLPALAVFSGWALANKEMLGQEGLFPAKVAFVRWLRGEVTLGTGALCAIGVVIVALFAWALSLIPDDAEEDRPPAAESKKEA